MPERRARRFTQVVQRPVDQVDVVAVEGHAPTLEQVEQVGARAFGHFPDRPGLDRDVLRAADAFQHRDRVARKLQDLAELAEGAVQFAVRFHQRRDVARPPRLLRFAHVGEEHEGDEAVRVRLPPGKLVPSPDLERRPRPVLGHLVIGLGTGPGRRRQRVLRGQRGQAPRVIGLAPGKHALDIRRGHPHLATRRIPRDAVAGIAQDGAIQFGLVIELGERVRLLHRAEGALALPRAVRVRLAPFQLDRGAPEQVAGDLIEQRPRVVEGEPSLAPAGPPGPLVALVELEVLAVAPPAAGIELLEEDRQGRFGWHRGGSIRGKCRHRAGGPG